MNYYGATLNQNLSEEAMDKVLRPALLKVGEDNDILPVRGPRRFINDNYEYTFDIDGNLERVLMGDYIVAKMCFWTHFQCIIFLNRRHYVTMQIYER